MARSAGDNKDLLEGIGAFEQTGGGSFKIGHPCVRLNESPEESPD